MRFVHLVVPVIFLLFGASSYAVAVPQCPPNAIYVAHPPLVITESFAATACTECSGNQSYDDALDAIDAEAANKETVCAQLCAGSSVFSNCGLHTAGSTTATFQGSECEISKTFYCGYCVDLVATSSPDPNGSPSPSPESSPEE